MPPTASDFLQALNAKFEEAIQAHRNDMEIRAGDLHRKVGGYPGPNHRLAVCCSVMKKEMRHGDELLDTTPSGIGANFIVRYRIPRPFIQNPERDIPSTKESNISLMPFAPTQNGNRENATSDMNITDNINKYMEGREPDKRYASFDYCFNYFQEFKERDNTREMAFPENIQQSCLQLGFFLASWGMFRGKAFLLQKSAKHFKGLVTAISKLDKKCWTIDVDKYDDQALNTLLEIEKEIADRLAADNKETSTTLSTKVMLGVLGCVPAFDENFCAAFKFRKKLTKESLEKIAKYYSDNVNEFNKFSIKTLAFATGQETQRLYTKAKLVDMVGFVVGDRIRASRRRKK